MKLRLTVILSGQAYQQIELERFEVVRIGRAPDCEVQLENAAVSRYHCEISRHGGVLRLRDLGSNNGTVLNGVKVEAHGLRHGDVISIGKLTIQVEVEGAPREARGSDRAPAGAMTVEADREALARAQRRAEQRVQGVLRYEGRSGTRELALDSLRTVFGKDPAADIHVGGLFAPRLAAVVLREDFGYRILDLSPRGNCVRVNGARATDVRLAHDDRIEVRGFRGQFLSGRPT